ncbi:MAG TPA: hypothetical protein VFI42_14005 [Thermomicrobiaceae bacterium]|nr:hypothetical protein [Thermomicrobiaceae bacterium]
MAVAGWTRARTTAAGEGEGAWLAGVAVMAGGSLLMLQAMRVFVSYLVFVLDQSQRAQIAGSVLAVILAIGLGGPLLRLLGPRALIAAAALLLGLARLGIQFSGAPGARLLLGAAGVVTWGWLALALILTRRRQAALGLTLGLWLDLALRVLRRGLDLPWLPSPAADELTIAIVTALVVAALWLARDLTPAEHSPTRLGALALAALGPGLAVFHLISGNLGLAQVKTGLAFPAAGALLTAGATLGLIGVSAGLPNRHALARPVLALLAAAGLWLFWQAGPLAGAGLAAGCAAGLMLLAGAIDTPGEPGERPGLPLPAATFWFTWGMLLQVAVLFAYYTFTGSPPAAAVAVALFLLGALVPTVAAGRR